MMTASGSLAIWKCLTASLFAAFLFGGAPLASAPPTSAMKKVLGLQLTVKVYNSAHVSRGDLMEAEDRAAIIFHQVKIKIIWDHAPMPNDVHDEFKGEAWNPADLHLRLWTRAVAG